MLKPSIGRRVMAAVAFLAGTAAAACADSAMTPVRLVAGCYRLTHSAWQGDASEVGALPDSVRLLSAAGRDGLESGRTVVRAYPDSLRMRFPWAWWEVASPDTLRLVFTTGYSGARAVLHPHGADYVGQLESFVDYPSPPAFAIVRLAPIACGA